jgi:hypothetical protein
MIKHFLTVLAHLVRKVGIINNIMKTIAILFSSLLLSACAARFSETNYDRMVNLVVVSRDPDTACQTQDTMKSVYSQLNTDGIHILEHSAGRKDPDITKMITDLNTEIKGFGDRLAQGKVSQFYCKAKIADINTGARIMLHAEGEKPRI